MDSLEAVMLSGFVLGHLYRVCWFESVCQVVRPFVGCRQLLHVTVVRDRYRMSMGFRKVSSSSWLVAAEWSVTTMTLRSGRCSVERVSVSGVQETHVQHLERLIGFHQLLAYPSQYARFNRGYDEAVACLNAGAGIRELYIVQYRSRHNAPGCGDDLYSSFVPSQLISSEGPYFLTDICAVVRTQPSTMSITKQKGTHHVSQPRSN